MHLQVISWFWPLAASPDRGSGWEFETNDFEGELICPLKTNSNG
jgi:hypothetical protein